MAMKINADNSEENTQRPQKAFTLDKEPSSWTAKWWPTARQLIENASPDQRFQAILDIELAVGQAISAFPDPHVKVSKQSEAQNYIGTLAKELKIDEYFKENRKYIDAGIKCGPFEEGDTIPSFIMEAWEEAKEEIVEPEQPTQVPVLPEEAGNFADFITDSEGTLHRLPTEVFHEDLQKVIREVAETKSVPESMVAGILLALGSACIGRSRGVMYRNDWKEHANLYMLLVVETGNGKSHTFDYIFKYVKEFEAKQKAIFKAAYQQYRDDMQVFLKSKDANKVPPKKPVNIQFLLDDSTMEAVSERLEDNPRGLFWTKDEFAGFFNSLDKYTKGGDGKNRLLQAWNVGPWSSSRKTKDGEMQERFIANGCIGMYGNVQPHLLKKLFTAEDIAQGLPQRFLYLRTPVEKPMMLPTPEISQETEQVIKCITEKLLSLDLKVDQYGNTRTSYLTLTPEAKIAFENFSNTMQKKSFGLDAQGYAAKLAQMTLRIALILHFLDWARVPVKEGETESYCDPEIGYATMCSATKIVNHLWSHTQYARAHFPGAMERKELSQAEIDEKKKAILKFVYKHEEFCKEWRGTTELIEAGLRWEKNEKSLGKYLTKHLFKKTPPKTKDMKYKLFPLPAGFVS